MGKRWSGWSNWVSENYQQLGNKRKKQSRINNQLKSRRVRADGNRQKLPLGWAQIQKQICMWNEGGEEWVRKEKWVACGLPARANRRKKAEQETDALNCKWPPQGKKQWAALYFLGCKLRSNSSLSARNLILAGRGKRGKKYFSLSFPPATPAFFSTYC